MLYLRLWDVQFGNAAYIRTPNGKHIVQDLGVGALKTGVNNFSPLLFLKNSMKVEQLDEVIITHPHDDHLRDIPNFDIFIPEVLSKPKHLTRQEVYAANRREDHELVEKYLDISKRYNADISKQESPLDIQNNGGATIDVFQSTGNGSLEINNHSSVTVISYANSKVLLPGDNDAESWQELLKMDRFVEAIKDIDIFVATHHGLESGFRSELFNYMSPKLIIISNGRFLDDGGLALYIGAASGWEVHRRVGGIARRGALQLRVTAISKSPWAGRLREKNRFYLLHLTC
jgi:competence protein ComEC